VRPALFPTGPNKPKLVDVFWRPLLRASKIPTRRKILKKQDPYEFPRLNSQAARTLENCAFRVPSKG
jgi:hypothetical protein